MCASWLLRFAPHPVRAVFLVAAIAPATIGIADASAEQTSGALCHPNCKPTSGAGQTEDAARQAQALAQILADMQARQAAIDAFAKELREALTRPQADTSRASVRQKDPASVSTELTNPRAPTLRLQPSTPVFESFGSLTANVGIAPGAASWQNRTLELAAGLLDPRTPPSATASELAANLLANPRPDPSFWNGVALDFLDEAREGVIANPVKLGVRSWLQDRWTGIMDDLKSIAFTGRPLTEQPEDVRLERAVWEAGFARVGAPYSLRSGFALIDRFSDLFDLWGRQ